MNQHIKAVKANFDARQKLVEELRSIDETAAGRAYDDDEAGKVAELRSTLSDIDSRLEAGLEQEIRSATINDATATMFGLLEDRNTGERVDTRSIGDRFTSDEFRSWAGSGARGASPAVDVEMDFRAVTDTTTGAASGGAMINNQRLGRVGQDFIDRRTFLVDLLPSIQVSTGSVEIVQDQSPLADMANKAAEVAEGAAKPQAGVTLAVVTEPVQTIAAWANITRQAAADSPMVRDYLDGRLRYSVKRRADGQVVNGNGTSPNLRGLLNRVGINAYDATGAGSEEAAVSIRKGITLMEEDEAVPEIIVLNPADAEKFDLTNFSSDGVHAVTNLSNGGPRTAWGMTQVRSTAIASGTALLIDPMAVAVLDRQQVTAYMTDSHASNFTSNILTLLLEARLGLALFDPAGVASVTFDYTA